jgi:hypothetical protein
LRLVEERRPPRRKVPPRRDSCALRYMHVGQGFSPADTELRMSGRASALLTAHAHVGQDFSPADIPSNRPGGAYT